MSFNLTNRGGERLVHLTQAPLAGDFTGGIAIELNLCGTLNYLHARMSDFTALT